MAQTDQDPGKELHIACTVGNVPRVSALLAQRFRRDWRDAAYGRTPLISAAASGHTEIVKLLVQDGESDINATDVENSWSALLAAVNFGHRKVVAALLADPRINPNIQSLSGSTALIDACRQADLETVKMLLEPGHWVDPSTSDNKGLSALDYCDGRIEPLILQALDRFIAEQPLPNEDPDETPLLSVEESQKLFHLACFGGHLGRVETFLRDAKLNLNAIDPEFGSSPLAAACLSGRTEIVDRLLEEKRLNPDQRSTAGLTPFMIACQQKHLAIMSSLLMDNRIDANAQTNDKGMTGLMICCETDFLDGIQLLLEFEGKVRLDIKDHSSRTALDYARGQGRELIEALSVVPKGRNSSLNPVPLEPPAAPTMASDRLHDFVEACQRGQLYLVGTYLAMYGPQCNALTTTGTTGFNEACAVGRVAVLDRLLRDPAIDPNVKDSKGRTGFFLACAKGHKEAIKLMLAFAGRIDLEQPCPDSILGRGPFKVTKKPVDVAPSELKQAIRDAIQAASAAKQLERAHILALPPAPLVLPPQPPPSRQPPPMPSSSPHPSLPPQRSPSFVVEAEQEVEVLERRRRGFRGVDSPDSATGSPLTPTFPQQEPSPVQSDTNSSQRRAPPTVPPPRLPRLDNLRGDSQSSSLPSPRSSRHSGSMTSKPRYWIEESDLEIDYKNQLGLEAFKAVYLGTVEVEVRFLDESIPSSKLEADFADWVDMPAHDNGLSVQIQCYPFLELRLTTRFLHFSRIAPRLPPRILFLLRDQAPPRRLPDFLHAPPRQLRCLCSRSLVTNRPRSSLFTFETSALPASAARHRD